MMLASLGTLFFLSALLKHFSLSSHPLILYAWNPLIIKEFVNSAHVDAAALFFLTASLYFLFKHRHSLSVLLLALATWTKLIPILFLPFYWKRINKRHRLLFLIASLLFYLPFLKDGLSLFHGLRVFQQNWIFNPGLFSLAIQALTPLFSKNITHLINSIFLCGTILGVGGYLYFTDHGREKDIWNSGFFLIVLLFVFSPVVDPWYLTLLIPWLVVSPKRCWLWLIGTVSLSYLFYQSLASPPYFQSIEWVGFLIFFFVDHIKPRLRPLSLKPNETEI